MKRSFVLVVVLLACILSSALTALVLKHGLFSAAIAQQSAPALEGITLYAGSRKDTEKDASFIFFNPKTGDIWVYQDEDFEEHYRIKAMGVPLEKVEK